MGSPHYGEGRVEHLAALAGEHPTTGGAKAGYGTAPVLAPIPLL